MSRSLRSFLPLDLDPDVATDAFRGDPHRWLPDARRVGADRYELPVGTNAWSHPVLLTVGAPWQVGRTWWRSFCWEPAVTASDAGVSRLLPRLDAELGLTCRPAGHATLVLDGRYDPPGGRFGDAVDAVALGRVASATVDRLLREITGLLGAGAPTPVPT
jgi:hypothetical protein